MAHAPFEGSQSEYIDIPFLFKALEVAANSNVIDDSDLAWTIQNSGRPGTEISKSSAAKRAE